VQQQRKIQINSLLVVFCQLNNFYHYINSISLVALLSLLAFTYTLSTAFPLLLIRKEESQNLMWMKRKQNRIKLTEKKLNKPYQVTIILLYSILF